MKTSLSHSRPQMIHTFYDGSSLRLIKASALIATPVWKGNRILDTTHVAAIQVAVGANLRSLDSGYCIIKYPELDASNNTVLASYVIDGQHRRAVLKAAFETPFAFEADFDVVVKEKHVTSESEAITYFNQINNSKPQQWKHDKKLLANNYIIALEGEFNVKKRHPVIRMGETRRPYISAEKVREQLVLCELKSDTASVMAFLTRAKAWNRKQCEEVQVRLAIEPEMKDASMWNKALELEFMLGMDFGWTLLL